MLSWCSSILLDQLVILALFPALMFQAMSNLVLCSINFTILSKAGNASVLQVHTRHISLKKGIDKILKKLGEESAETIIAAKNEDPSRLVSEVSDLLYHLLVLLVARGISLDEIAKELGERRKGQRETQPG